MKDINRFRWFLKKIMVVGQVIAGLSRILFNGSERMVRRSGTETRSTHRLQWGIVDNARKRDRGVDRMDDGVIRKHL